MSNGQSILHEPGGKADDGLTIVIPNYNHSRFIRQSIDSLLAQTRLPDRVIIIDDASTDDSVAVIKSYADRFKFIELHTNSVNIGVVKTLNLGLSIVDTEYVAFLAADDFIENSLYEKSLDLLNEHRAAPLCTSLSNYVDEQAHLIPSPRLAPLGDRPRYLAPDEVLALLTRYGSFLNGNSAIYRTKPLKEIGGFDETLRSFCDGYAMQLLTARNGVCFVPEILCNWRRLKTSYAATTEASFDVSVIILMEINKRVDGPHAAIFPPSYRQRLMARLRFSALWAAAKDPEADLAEIMSAIGPRSRVARRLVTAAERILGRTNLRIPLFLIVRPWDLLGALWRYSPRWGRKPEYAKTPTELA